MAPHPNLSYCKFLVAVPATATRCFVNPTSVLFQTWQVQWTVQCTCGNLALLATWRVREQQEVQSQSYASLQKEIKYDIYIYIAWLMVLALLQLLVLYLLYLVHLHEWGRFVLNKVPIVNLLTYFLSVWSDGSPGSSVLVARNSDVLQVCLSHPPLPHEVSDRLPVPGILQLDCNLWGWPRCKVHLFEY